MSGITKTAQPYQALRRLLSIPLNPIHGRSHGRCGFVSFPGLLLATAIVAHTEFGFLSQAHAAASVAQQSGDDAIPLTEIAAEAETASARLHDLRAELASNARTDTIAKQLPALGREIETRIAENRKILAQRPALEILDTIEAEWRRLRRREAGYSREVTARLTRLQQDILELQKLHKLWQQTAQLAQNSAAPAEVLSRTASIVAQIEQTADGAEQQRARDLTLQSRLATEDARIADALASISQTRDDARNHVFIMDAPPIWSLAAVQLRRDVLEEGSGSFFRQSEALSTYTEPQLSRFLAHLLFLAAMIAACYWVRAKARDSGGYGSDLDPFAFVLEQPLATAFLLSSLSIPLIYPEAPRLLWAIFGFLVLLPSLIILGRAAPGIFRSVLYVFLVFYVLDQIRTLAAAVPLVPRLLFLAEMFGAASLALLTLRRLNKSPLSTSVWNSKLARATLAAAVLLALAGLAANTIGYITLGTLLGNALLGGAYFGIILLAVIQVLEGLTALSLRRRPLCLLAGVRRHGLLFQRRIRVGLWRLGAIAWVDFILRKLLVRDSLFAAAQILLTARLTIGSLHMAFGDLLAFAFTIWAAFLVSRFIRFLLDEEIYPRVPLAPGLPYAISTMMHYGILLVGFLAAVAVLGIDMTKVTILAGAFSVGVGLGLQNIFNNFVSGVILLFERPVKVGDVIQIDDVSGVVEHIGIRASIMRTTEGSEVIMPNGKLISDRVINWTLTNRQHSIELPIAVAPGAEPTKVVTLLERAAMSHPLIAKNPPPQALVVKLGPDALGLELRVWTDRLEQWMEIRSELAIKVSAALAAENIAIH